MTGIPQPGPQGGTAAVAPRGPTTRRDCGKRGRPDRPLPDPERQPTLAALGRRRLVEPGVVLVATIRKDGTPRDSPVEPLVLDGMLWLFMLWHSRKAADLLRDPRILVHSIITSRDGGEGEFKVRGTARAQNNPRQQARYAAAVSASVGWTPQPGRFHLFAVDVSQVTFICYDDATGDQHVARWPPGEEFIRRGTTATSLGEPEPTRDILVGDPLPK